MASLQNHRVWMNKQIVNTLRKRLEDHGITCGLDRRIMAIYAEAPDLTPDEVRQLLVSIPTSAIDQAFQR